MRQTGLLICFVLLFMTTVHAQVPIDTEMKLESIAEFADDEDIDLMQLAENLEHVAENRININDANKETLSLLPFLNAFQVHNILQYIKRYGPIVHPYELTAIRTIDERTAGLLLDYIYFGKSDRDVFRFKDAVRYTRQNSILRWDRVLQEREGYRRRRLFEENGEPSGSHYLGDPNRFLLRHRISMGRHIQMGFTAEKDPGEPWGLGTFGFDFASGFLGLFDVGRVKQLVVGDFQAQFGQGLALWSSLAFNKSAMSLNTQRFGRGFSGSTGVDENRYFRGAAVTLDLGIVDVSAFASRTHVDASPNTQVDGAFMGIQSSGLHRTPTEIANRRQLGVASYGGHVKYGTGSLTLGSTIVANSLDAPIVPANQLHRIHQFRGNERLNASLDYQWIIKGIQVYGEAAVNERGQFATTNGAYVELDKRLIFSINQRWMSPQYDALYMAPFGETSAQGSGESGTYLGIEWRHNAKFTSNAYVDHYRFQWMRFHTSAPSHGRDYLWQTVYNINRKSLTYTRLRWQQRDINQPDEMPVRQQSVENRISVRQHFQTELSEVWSMATRMEYSERRFMGDAEQGWLLYQDLRYHLKKSRLLFTARYAMFHTDGYNARIYAYEHDVLYAFSIPPYFDRGTRFYAIAKWDISKRATLWLRYAQTYFYEREVIGSGLNEIKGNRMDEVRIQLRVKI